MIVSSNRAVFPAVKSAYWSLLSVIANGVMLRVSVRIVESPNRNIAEMKV
jgi:hypothetical protein